MVIHKRKKGNNVHECNKGYVYNKPSMPCCTDKWIEVTCKNCIKKRIRRV